MRTFKRGKSAKELGLQVTQCFRIVKPVDQYDAVGDILIFVLDDGGPAPLFFNTRSGVITFCCWGSLTHATPTKRQAKIAKLEAKLTKLRKEEADE